MKTMPQDDSRATPGAAEASRRPVPAQAFGKDHWSLLAYAETRCVDFGGQLDHARIRDKHRRSSSIGWQPSWGSRLAGFFEDAGGDFQTGLARGLVLPHHDDRDCLDDLEAAGLLRVISLANLLVRMTPGGQEVVHELRRHKAAGRQFAEFRISAQRAQQLLLAAADEPCGQGPRERERERA